MMKVFLSLFIFAQLALTACSNESSSSIKVGLSTAPVTLASRYVTDAVSYRITRLIYKSLVDFYPQFQAVSDLASWQQLALNHYRFTLKSKNRTFHDGIRLTTKDVKATYQSILAPETGSPHEGSLQMISAIEIIDDDTIDFKLSRPDPLFPGRLVIGILPAKQISSGHGFNQTPIGSGAIRFSEWQDDTRLTLVRISDDQAIEFITVKDPTSEYLNC